MDVSVHVLLERPPSSVLSLLTVLSRPYLAAVEAEAFCRGDHWRARVVEWLPDRPNGLGGRDGVDAKRADSGPEEQVLPGAGLLAGACVYGSSRFSSE